MRVLVSPIVFNEEKKIRNVIRRLKESQTSQQADILVLGDGSTDGSKDILRSEGIPFLSQAKQSGVGSAIRTVFDYAKEKGYDISVIMAGNDKDDPSQINRLTEPILQGGCDLVQGSRYLPGGCFGNMPYFRQVATRFIHPTLFSFISGRKITDSTNGFRAVRLAMLDDPKINLTQSWLKHYELEPYLFYKAITLGYRVKEVPVTKVYPSHALGYTKIKPIIGWWSLLRPLVFLGLGIKK